MSSRTNFFVIDHAASTISYYVLNDKWGRYRDTHRVNEIVIDDLPRHTLSDDAPMLEQALLKWFLVASRAQASYLSQTCVSLEDAPYDIVSFQPSTGIPYLNVSADDNRSSKKCLKKPA